MYLQGFKQRLGVTYSALATFSFDNCAGRPLTHKQQSCLWAGIGSLEPSCIGKAPLNGLGVDREKQALDVTEGLGIVHRGDAEGSEHGKRMQWWRESEGW